MRFFNNGGSVLTTAPPSNAGNTGEQAPTGDAGKALAAINGKSPPTSLDNKQAVMDVLEINQQRQQLQENMKNQAADLNHEFQNLQVIIKSLQRDLEFNGGKLSDIDGRMKSVERETKIQRRLGSGSASQTGEADADTGIEGEADDKLNTGFSHLLDTELNSSTIPFVSKKTLQQAVEGLRDELKAWLDMLHASMLNALQQKADRENLGEMVHQLQQATEVAGDSFALFAKRPLMGRCASCEKPFDVDTANVKRTPPVSLKPQMHPRSCGAENAIRPLEINQRPATSIGATSPSKLPKLGGNKDFPKGKILKNSSQPELRAMRQTDLPSLVERQNHLE